jgi:hypothetical protein
MAGESLLSRAFDLAKLAIESERQGKVSQAKDQYTASIESFRAVLLIPNFVKDISSKQLIEQEIQNLVERKSNLLNHVKQEQILQSRFKTLVSGPTDEQNLRQRFQQLRGLDKPGQSLDQLTERLNKLKATESAAVTGQTDNDKATTGSTTTTSIGGNEISSDIITITTTTKLDPKNAFAGDDWKQGLDPELLDIIEQARDEVKYQ